MRLPFWLPTWLTAVAIAGCSGPVNIVLGTDTPSATGTVLPAVTPVAAASLPRVTAPSAAVTSTRTPAATKTPSPTLAPLDIEGQQLPIPAEAKETKNIPAAARDWAQNQLRGQVRIGPAHAFFVPGKRREAAQAYRQELSAAGWEAIPIAGLRDPLDVLFAQKANVRATIVFATADNGSTVIYIVATRR